MKQFEASYGDKGLAFQIFAQVNSHLIYGDPLFESEEKLRQKMNELNILEEDLFEIEKLVIEQRGRLQVFSMKSIARFFPYLTQCKEITINVKLTDNCFELLVQGINNTDCLKNTLKKLDIQNNNTTERAALALNGLESDLEIVFFNGNLLGASGVGNLLGGQN